MCNCGIAKKTNLVQSHPVKHFGGSKLKSKKVKKDKKDKKEKKDKKKEKKNKK